MRSTSEIYRPAQRETKADSTYIINVELGLETARVAKQASDTSAITGLFPVRVVPTEGAKILDIGCGAGDWVLDVAHAYPGCEVLGIDISKTIVDYANARAKTQKLNNASFEVIDALTGLDALYECSLDVVNLRFAAGWVPRTGWIGLLAQCKRLLKAGGYFISTEGEWPLTNSNALNQLSLLLSRAIWLKGLGLSDGGDTLGVAFRMNHMLHDLGFESLYVNSYPVDFSFYNAVQHERWISDLHMTYHLVRDFVTSNIDISQEHYNAVLDNMVQETWKEEFTGLGFFYSHSAMKG